jgi:3-methyladenine DNA glycosylase AlkD
LDTAVHDEVVSALRAIGDPRYGAAVRADRRSELEYLGIGFPELRARVKRGFSFYGEPSERVLHLWDGLWKESPYGEVLFAVMEYYRKAPKRRPVGFWAVAKGWIGRIDNWAHADVLGGLYSELLEEEPGSVLPTLRKWNTAEGLWHRRVSLVSLIHYSGKNAVFMPPGTVLPMVTNCLADERYYVQTAIGWVLREMGNAYPDEILTYLRANVGVLSAEALSRAIERRSPEEKAELRALRKATRSRPVRSVGAR